MSVQSVSMCLCIGVGVLRVLAAILVGKFSTSWLQKGLTLDFTQNQTFSLLLSYQHRGDGRCFGDLWPLVSSSLITVC